MYALSLTVLGFVLSCFRTARRAEAHRMEDCSTQSIDGWQGRGDFYVSDSCYLNTKALLGLWAVSLILWAVLLLRSIVVTVRFMRGKSLVAMWTTAGWRTPFLILGPPFGDFKGLQPFACLVRRLDAHGGRYGDESGFQLSARTRNRLGHLDCLGALAHLLPAPESSQHDLVRAAALARF